MRDQRVQSIYSIDLLCCNNVAMILLISKAYLIKHYIFIKKLYEMADYKNSDIENHLESVL